MQLLIEVFALVVTSHMQSLEVPCAVIQGPPAVIRGLM